MPVEPLSITAAVIGVVRLTYDSCKSLNEKLKGIKHAPEKLENLHRDLDAFQAFSTLMARQALASWKTWPSHQIRRRVLGHYLQSWKVVVRAV